MLPARLRFLRKEQKLTQDQVSKGLGISRARYSHWENGIHEPPNDVLQRIADFYDTSTEYLLGRTDERDRTTKPVYDQQTTAPDLNKILRETAPTWNGKPLTPKQAKFMIKLFETMLEEVNGHGSESEDE